MSTAAENITELLHKKFEEPEYQQFFLVDVQVLPKDIVHIFIDSDAGLMIEDCASISRFVEEQIETNAWLGETYTIEVSSPGITTPLKLKRQYIKNIGRLVSVELSETHVNIKGTLSEVKDNSIVVSYQEKVQLEGKKKKQILDLQQEIPFDKIKSTTVKVSFK